jgi:hypothetical protein
MGYGLFVLTIFNLITTIHGHINLIKYGFIFYTLGYAYFPLSLIYYFL